MRWEGQEDLFRDLKQSWNKNILVKMQDVLRLSKQEYWTEVVLFIYI